MSSSVLNTFPALPWAPSQSWPNWDEVDEADELFNTCADIPDDELPGFAHLEGLFSQSNNEDSHPPLDCPSTVPRCASTYREQTYQENQSGSISPVVTGPVDSSKDERALKRSVGTPSDCSEDLVNVTEQLTNRLGRLQIAEDGHPRYFGSTSNLYILHHGPKSLHKPNIRDVMALGDAAAEAAGYYWKPDVEYETELITLFFSWYNALVNVVDEKIFCRERILFKSGKRSDLYSPALENAV